MGRTNGKLIPFLKGCLEKKSFVNLKWENEMAGIFSLKLPRYEKKKNLELYEGVLQQWYYVSKRTYAGYSTGKAVIQANLRKSVYLVVLKPTNSLLHFRFATKEEAEEKAKEQRDKEKGRIQKANNVPALTDELDLPISLISPQTPSSISSGYQSENEDSGEMFNDEDFLNDLLKDPEKFRLNNEPDYIKGDSGLSASFDASLDAIFGNISPDSNVLNYINGDNDVNASMDALFNNIPPDIEGRDEPMSQAAMINSSNEEIATKDDELLQVSDTIQGDLKPVVDITDTVVNSAVFSKTYWLCSRKLYIDSMLLLICDKQSIGSENRGIAPDQIVVPTNVFKSGITYNLKTKLEVAGKFFLFLMPNN